MYSNLSYLKLKLNNISSSGNNNNKNINLSNNDDHESEDQTTSRNSLSGGSSYYLGDASVLEAKRYRELLQQRLQNKQTRLQQLQSPSSENVFLQTNSNAVDDETSSNRAAGGVLQDIQITSTVKIMGKSSNFKVFYVLSESSTKNSHLKFDSRRHSIL